MLIRHRFTAPCPLQRVRRCKESGMTIPFLAVSLLTFMGFAGLAADVARIQIVQAKLSYALDAAGLAAGASYNQEDYRTVARQYISLNFPTGYLGAEMPTSEVTTLDNGLIINLTGSTTVPTSFMSLFGLNSVTVSASSQITRQVSGLEVVMVLDNTGSMSSSSKLVNLKTAAITLVNILTNNQESARNLWMGLVPFSQTVNIGKTHANWVNQNAYYSTLKWATTGTTGLDSQDAYDWGGCVDARYSNGRDTTDDPPAVEDFHAYLYPTTTPTGHPPVACVGGNNTWVRSYDGNGNVVPCSGIGVNKVPLDNYSGFRLGPNLGCPQKITPMTASATTVINNINAMKAIGNTHINLGMVWGWRMISPHWRDLGSFTPWSQEMVDNGLPLDYNTPRMSKAVVLLTDGDNTMSSSVRTAYGKLSEGHLGTTWDTNVAETNLDNKFKSICTSLKSHNVKIYTIALGSPSTSTKTMLKNCASGDLYYFLSPTADQLEAVFKAIGDSLSNLRVSQ
jgi:hypothetical protein